MDDALLAGALALLDYLDRHAITMAAFGGRIGVSEVTVHRWLRGKARPSPDNAGAIQRETSGEVLASSFYPELAPVRPPTPETKAA